MKSGGTNLQIDRLNEFNNHIRMMTADFDEASKCQEILDNLLKTIKTGYNN
jgi:hypothetical protein